VTEEIPLRRACSRQTALAASNAAFLSSPSTAAVGRNETSGAGPLRLHELRAAPKAAVTNNAVQNLDTILHSLFDAPQGKRRTPHATTNQFATVPERPRRRQASQTPQP
jgi:hypothetical protein